MGLDEEVRRRAAAIRSAEERPYLAKLKEQGKMYIRDRIALLIDPGSEVEDGLFARCEEEGLPADAVVTLIAKIDGRPVCIMGNDMTVKAGTWGIKTIEKMIRIQEIAFKRQIPIIYLIDSAGARLNEQFETFMDRTHAGRIFWNNCRLSGVVPQIAVVFGPSPAGSAYIPALCDVVIMVDKNTSVYLGSPRMAEMAMGEKVTHEEMGGAEMHCSVSGLGDYLAANEEEALGMARRYLTFFPQNSTELPPAVPAVAPADGKAIEEIVPAHQGMPFNMYEVIDRVVDQGSFFDFKRLYAPELITGLARLDGKVIGIVGNQSSVKGGALFPESAEKGAHFISLCNAYNIPLLFLMDIPGFMIGSQVERQAIIRRGAKWLMTLCDATVPKISVIVRKAYGAGYLAMSGASFQPDSCIALPTAMPAVMGPEAAVNAMYLNKIMEITDQKERMKYVFERRKEYMANINAWRPASELFIDNIVPGDELRAELIKRYAFYAENRSVADRVAPRRTWVHRG